MAGLSLASNGADAWVARAWVVDTDGRLLGTLAVGLPVRHPAAQRSEFDPLDWWAAARSGLAAVVAGVSGDYLALTVTAPPAFLLTDGRVELGQGVLPGDRRGAGWLAQLRAHRQLYAMTRHWPAAELTLPKLLAIRAESPRRWADARRLLFLSDWLIWRLTGVEATEVSAACAGQLAHVSQRGWAGSLLDDLDVARRLLAPLVEPGQVLGLLREGGLGLPAGLPVVAGCGDRQLTAAGVGAAHPGAMCVLAGAADSTLLAAADYAPLDAAQRPLVTTHAPRDTWAVELPCGSPGRMLNWLTDTLAVPVEELPNLAASSRPGAGGLTALVGIPHCTEQRWAAPVPPSLLGVDPASGPAELAAAVIAGYAYALRANLADLADVLGHPAGPLVLTGSGANDGLADLLAGVTGRDVAVPAVQLPAAQAAAALAAAAVGASSSVTLPEQRVFPAADPAPHDEPYARYLVAYDAMYDASMRQGGATRPAG